MDDLTHSAIAAGTLIGEPKDIDGGVIPYAVVPNDARIEALEHYLPAPVRARAKVIAHDVTTFNAYVSRFKAGATALFADIEHFTIVGIIDYHTPEAAAFCDHRVTYNAPRAPEWRTWRKSSGSVMSQVDFARFLEDNLVDIRTPAGADVLEVARTLHAKKSVDFSSSIRLSDGQQQFAYSETIDGQSRNGALKVPESFTLGIPVFLGGVHYEVTARLRYRIQEGGKLSLWYELYRPEQIERDAFDQILADVDDGTGIEVWRGAPG